MVLPAWTELHNWTWSFLRIPIRRQAKKRIRVNTHSHPSIGKDSFELGLTLYLWSRKLSNIKGYSTMETIKNKGLIAVLGGTGRIGSSVVEALRLNNFPVRVITRSKEKRESFRTGVEGIVGDPNDAGALDALVDGAYGLFFVSFHDDRELEIGRQVIKAAQAAGVKKIVFASAAYPNPKNPVVRKLLWTLLGQMSPHYKPKLILDETVRRLPNGTVLMPANFFQNDDIYQDDILDEGIYPQPVGSKGTCRIDTRDIGDAAVKIFSEDGHAGNVYPLAGPLMNGDQIAEVLSETLGKPVKYGGDDLDQWEIRVKGRLATKERKDFRKTYELMQKVGFGLPQSAQDEGETLLGRPYRQYQD